MTRSTKLTRTAVPFVGKPTDARVVGASLFLLPVQTRVPLKFGAETLTSVTCARVRLDVRDRHGRTAHGWGETPLSVQWAWPSALTVAERQESMVRFCTELASAWSQVELYGHPLEVGHAFLQAVLPAVRNRFNDGLEATRRIPFLSALVCLSAFDLALHDAYGILNHANIYETYNRQWMNRDLSWYLEPATDSDVEFTGLYPQDFLRKSPAKRLAAWHLVGGLDPVDESDTPIQSIDDHLPVRLKEWIDRDGLVCLKIKLRGNDAAWDYNRLIQVGRIALAKNVTALSADFNCTVTEPAYVNQILDRLAAEHTKVYERLLYVEQPFPYELEDHPIDVRSVAARKPLFMDESAHDWQQIRLGRALGWTGVALKTCKTQTGAILSLCWAKAHKMQLMVQDLTNPMLAQIPHVSLAAHIDTVLGVETNSMQFYPEASAAEAKYHPGVYSRTNGQVDVSSLRGPGFGYNGAEEARVLPGPAAIQHWGTPTVVPRWHVS